MDKYFPTKIIEAYNFVGHGLGLNKVVLNTVQGLLCIVLFFVIKQQYFLTNG